MQTLLRLEVKITSIAMHRSSSSWKTNSHKSIFNKLDSVVAIDLLMLARNLYCEI